MNYINICAGVFLVGILVYYYLTKNYGYWKNKNVPYIKDTLPGLGNIYPMIFMKRHMMELYKDFYDKMPGCSMVGFFNLRTPALLIKEPELIKTVLQTNFTSFTKNGLAINPELDHLAMRNPFFLEGDKWKGSRQQLSSAFTSGKLKIVFQSINDVCGKFVKYLDENLEKNGGEVELELKNVFSRYTAEVVASAGFGIEGNSFKHDGEGIFSELGKKIFDPSASTGFNGFITIFFPFLSKILKTSIIPPEVTKKLISLVRDVVKYRVDNNIERSDFLQLMINLKKNGALDHAVGGQFNDESICSHASSFFFDGYETSSVALAFMGYQLASHPDIQQKVRDEIVAAVKKHDGLTYEALQELSYTERVLYESMRLYPPGGVFFKTCTRDVDLKGSDGITCRLTAGTPVMISANGLHRDPEYWPDPEKFDPDRFTEENKHSRHRFTFIPFGEGPRICVGMPMALLQIKANIATTILKYNLELSPKTKVPIQFDPRHFMLTALGGIWVKFRSL